jgi:hypothetical protein
MIMQILDQSIKENNEEFRVIIFKDVNFNACYSLIIKKDILSDLLAGDFIEMMTNYYIMDSLDFDLIEGGTISKEDVLSILL